MEQAREYFRFGLEMMQKYSQRMRPVGVAAIGAAAMALGYSYYKNQGSTFNTFVMPVARILPAEASHNLAVWACKHKLYPTNENPDDINLHTKFFGRLISNPIGIAAGFDKHGEAIEGLQGMGFGFIEIGTVTPAPQRGNSGTRVFRLSSDRAIINRYGFNSEGHMRVLERLKLVKRKEDFNGVVGVNLGRNRRTKDAAEDYVKGVEAFGPVADYLVINVSSPNTRGLRDLQSKENLEELLVAVNAARNALGPKRNVPILLKLSPDLDVQDVKDVVAVVKKRKCHVDGLIVANTTVNRDNVNQNFKEVAGGLSGQPLRERSTQMIALVYHLTRGKIPIIGVGGVASGQDAYEKIEAGASYLQLYTALVYEGPEVVHKIKEDLSQLVQEFGFNNIQDAVGTNYRAYLPKQ